MLELGIVIQCFYQTLVLLIGVELASKLFIERLVIFFEDLDKL